MATSAARLLAARQGRVRPRRGRPGFAARASRARRGRFRRRPSASKTALPGLRGEAARARRATPAARSRFAIMTSEENDAETRAFFAGAPLLRAPAGQRALLHARACCRRSTNRDGSSCGPRTPLPEPGRPRRDPARAPRTSGLLDALASRWRRGALLFPGGQSAGRASATRSSSAIHRLPEERVLLEGGRRRRDPTRRSGSSPSPEGA